MKLYEISLAVALALWVCGVLALGGWPGVPGCRAGGTAALFTDCVVQ